MGICFVFVKTQDGAASGFQTFQGKGYGLGGDDSNNIPKSNAKTIPQFLLESDQPARTAAEVSTEVTYLLFLINLA